MKILVINAGSSSLKYQLIDMDNESVMAKGLCERIGIDGHLKHTPLVGGKPVYDENLSLTDFADLCRAHGPDRILFATDSPWRSQREFLSLFHSLPLTDDEKEQILYRNTKKILSI